MQARDLMQKPAIVIRQDETVANLCNVLQAAHINGLPVVDDEGEIVGIVTEEDILYGSMGDSGAAPVAPATAGDPILVRDIMTSPAVCATEETEIVEICRLMWTMRIHRVPIVLDGRVTGIVSAMDLVRAIAEGAIRP
jgi:CBS domain-containing protein